MTDKAVSRSHGFYTQFNWQLYQQKRRTSFNLYQKEKITKPEKVAKEVFEKDATSGGNRIHLAYEYVKRQTKS